MEEYKGYYIEERWATPSVPYECVVYESDEKMTRGDYSQVFNSVDDAKTWIDAQPVEYYMISPIGFDTAAILAVFWKKLRYTSPTELELTLKDILDEVEMTDERKRKVRDTLQQMAARGLIDMYGG